MSGRIYRREGVDDDIADIAMFFLGHSESLAIRFIDAVQSTLKDLARAPGIGSPKDYESPRLVGTRSWWVRGFRDYLIFYVARDDGIDVLAVAHGSQDLPPLLEQRT